ESGTIGYFTDNKLALKLLDMGCLPGTKIQMKFCAPLGDPICIDVEGYRLSLRKAEAATITLQE
ncbi:MAG: FeoA domain-containing protein, partial [Bacteroidota bacterium]